MFLCAHAPIYGHFFLYFPTPLFYQLCLFLTDDKIRHLSLASRWIGNSRVKRSDPGDTTYRNRILCSLQKGECSWPHF